MEFRIDLAGLSILTRRHDTARRFSPSQNARLVFAVFIAKRGGFSDGPGGFEARRQSNAPPSKAA